MEKLGVEFDDRLTKQAEEGNQPNTCPACGRDAGEERNCPVHGTEYFERG